MWECPKCHREFSRKNQSHSCGTMPVTIDEYIESQNKEIQAILKEVREAIRETIPKAKEKISWGMPTYWEGHNIIHFAAAKKHLGLYPGSEAIEHFSEELKAYKSTKGACQFQYSAPMPIDLIKKITLWCYETGNHH